MNAAVGTTNPGGSPVYQEVLDRVTGFLTLPWEEGWDEHHFGGQLRSTDD